MTIELYEKFPSAEKEIFRISSIIFGFVLTFKAQNVILCQTFGILERSHAMNNIPVDRSLLIVWRSERLGKVCVWAFLHSLPTVSPISVMVSLWMNSEYYRSINPLTGAIGLEYSRSTACRLETRHNR